MAELAGEIRYIVLSNNSTLGSISPIEALHRLNIKQR